MGGCLWMQRVVTVWDMKLLLSKLGVNLQQIILSGMNDDPATGSTCQES